MRGEEQSDLTGISTHDIVAAWAFCGLVMLGLFVADLAHPRDNAATAVDAGTPIPGGAGRLPRESDVADDAHINRPRDVGIVANGAAPAAIGPVDVSAKVETAGEPKPAGRYCQYVLRRRGIRYSAAAASLAAGLATAGVREAAQ